MLTTATLKAHVEQLMEREFDRVPRMREFHEGTWNDRSYFVRHLIETVLRIRLNNEVSTYALYRVGSSDDPLAGKLAKYLAEEYGHEHLFMRDLNAFGVTLDQVNDVDVFLATKSLMGYMRLAVDHHGPVPMTAWDWFVEWYSHTYNNTIANAAAASFGEDHLKGSFVHFDFDEGHGHLDLMHWVLTRSAEKWGDDEMVLRYLRDYVRLVGDYFNELHDATVAPGAVPSLDLDALAGRAVFAEA